MTRIFRLGIVNGCSVVGLTGVIGFSLGGHWVQVGASVLFLVMGLFAVPIQALQARALAALSGEDT